MVRRGRLHRRRHPDELSRRGSCVERRARLEPTETLCLLAAHPRSRRLQACPDPGRPVRAPRLAKGLGPAPAPLIEQLEDSRDAEWPPRPPDDARATELIGDLAQLQATEPHVADDRDDILF